MELNGERTIPASVDATWTALNDPAVLKACIPGCESLERTGDNTLAALVALKVGPVSARFKGNVAMTNVQPPTGYTINFDGQGGVAGFGKGSADVALVPDGAATKLSYQARATVGGKMAQIGSRLIDATAAKLTEEFFSAFEAQLQAQAAPVADAVADAGAGVVAESGAGVGAESGAGVGAGAPAPAPARDDRSVAKLWWLIGAIVVLAVLYFMIRK